MRSKIAAAGLFLAALCLYLRSAAPGLAFEDSGEIVASALTLGVPHPPGHVWPELLGRLFACLPFGDPAFRLNVLSAVCGAVGVLAAWRFGRAVSGIAAACVLAVCPLAWWQAGAAEKYIMAAALVAWGLVALRNALDEEPGRWFLLGTLLFGLSLGVHPLGLFLVPVLGWVWWRRRSSRSGWLAVFVVALAAGAWLLYVPIRAHAHPAVCSGMPDSFPGFRAYLAASRYLDPFLLRDASFGGLASAALQHAFVLPWRQAGLLALVALLGAWAVWHRDRRTAVLLGGLFLAGAAAGVVYQNPAADRYDLPACFVLAAFAGAGVEWLAGLWAWAPAVCLAIWGWGAVAAAPAAMRDRDTAATDHVRNLLMFVKPGDLVVAWGDTTLFPLRYARIVDGRREAARVESADGLAYGAPARARLASSGDPRLAPLGGGGSGPALLWQLRRTSAKSDVWLVPEEPPALIPSRGVRWRGLAVRVTDSREPAGLDDYGIRWLRGLRLRPLFRARGLFEAMVVRNDTYSLNTRAQLLLRAGRAREAEVVLRTGIRLEPGLPELRQTLGRSLLAQGRGTEAAAEWQAAITLTRNMYLDPYLGLAEVARRRAGTTAEDEELEMLRTAAILGAPGRDGPSAPVTAGDDARSRGDWQAARAAYRRAVAVGLVGRGLAHFQAGRLPQAGAAWEEALGFDPRSAQAMQDLGTLAALEERFGDALTWYLAAASAGARSPGLDDNLVQAREAVHWQAKVEPLEARARARPRDSEALIAAGNAEWYVGRTPAAEAAYRRAVLVDPGNVRALTNLGSALVQQGRPREAIRVYERAVRANPKYAGAMVNLATVYLGLGDRKTAGHWARRTLEADPKEPRALQMMKELGG